MKKYFKEVDNTISEYWELALWLILVVAAIFVFSTFGFNHVRGRSMEPSFSDGDWVIIMETSAIEDGDVVIVNSKGIVKADWIIKRYCEDKSSDSEVWLEGDNKDISCDSRLLGPVDRNRVVAKAVFNITRFEFVK